MLNLEKFLRNCLVGFLLSILCYTSPMQGGMYHGKVRGGHTLLNPSLSDVMFVNYIKGCGSWFFTGSLSIPFPNLINADGYLQSAPSQIMQCNIVINDGFSGVNAASAYTGNWIISWKGSFGSGGTAGVTISGSAFGSPTVVSDPGGCVVSTSGALQLSKSDCTVTFSYSPSLTHGIFVFHYQNAGANGVSNVTEINLYRADQATNFANGEILNPDYINYIKSLKPKILRFLQWQNTTNATLPPRFWAMTPTTAFSYKIPRWAKLAWVGSSGSPGCTSADGINYIASTPTSWEGSVGSKPHDGDFIQCEVSASNIGATVNLKVGTTDNIVVAKGLNFAVMTANTVVSGTGLGYSFIYNAQKDRWIAVVGTDLTGGSFAFSFPVTVNLALCNAVSADCWNQIPVTYDTVSAAAMGSSIASGLSASSLAYMEFSNEIFLNFTSQGNYANAMGAAIGFPNAGFGDRQEYDWYGLQVKRMYDAIKAAWPVGDTRFRGLMTNQIGSPTQFKAYKLEGSDLTLNTSGNSVFSYCTSSCGIDYTSAPNRPVDALAGTNGTGAISIGTYWGPPNLLSSYAPNTWPSGSCGIGTNTTTSACAYTTLEANSSHATVASISSATPAVATVSGGNAASWANGDRVRIDLVGGITGFTTAWTTIENFTNAGGGNFTFTLSANTTGDNGATLTACVTVTCSGMTGTPTARRVVLALNDAMLNASSQYAAGATDTALSWAYNDAISGTRSGDPNYNINAFITNPTGYLFINTAVCSTGGYPPLVFQEYEGAQSVARVSTINGQTLGWTSTQITQAQAFFDAWMQSDYLQAVQNYFYTQSAALPCFQYPAQFFTTGAGNWAITTGTWPNNYAPGNGSYATYTGFSLW